MLFDIPLLYCHTNLDSSIIFSEDIYLSISILPTFCECSSLGDLFEILSEILVPIKSPVASAIFWIALFEAVFFASVVDFLALSRSFLLYLLLKFLLVFSFHVLSLGSIEYLIFIMAVLFNY